MKKRSNNKGFTMAELLIVVAIIAVLVAIAIPVFTTQLERSRESTDLANIRAAYAEAMTDYLAKGTSATATGSIKQQDAEWHIDNKLVTRVDGVEKEITVGDVTVGGTFTVTVNPDATDIVTVTFAGAATASSPG